MNNNLSLLKLINGLSQSIKIANQLIPLYKQAKPIIENTEKMLNKLQNMNLNLYSEPTKNIEKKEVKITYDNQPTFFK